MLDFESILDPWAWVPQRRIPEADIGERVRFAPMSPEEEAAKLPGIAGAALGGIGYLGASLNKPGRMVRGLLGGKPRELLNAIPFSDALGITDPADETTGRDLLRHAGMIDQEDTWGNFAGGLAVDLFTDPLMWATFGSGAATQAGKVAQKIGALPKGQTARMTGSLGKILAAKPELQALAETAAGGAPKLAAMVDQPLAGLFGWHVPFSGALVKGGIGGTFLEGQAGADVLNAVSKGAQAVGKGAAAINHLPYYGGHLVNALTFGAPAAIEYGPKVFDWMRRYGRANFDARVLGAVTEAGQKAGEEATALKNSLAGERRTKLLEFGQQLTDAGATDAGDFRRVVENQLQHPDQVVNQVGAGMRAMTENMADRAMQLGIPLRKWGDPLFADIEYAPRQMSQAAMGTNTAEAMAALRPTDPTIQTARKSYLEGMRGATEDGFNKMALDPLAYQGTPKQRIDYVMKTYLPNPQDLAQWQAFHGELDPKNINRAAASIRRHNQAQARKLLYLADNLNPAVRESIGTANPIKPFGNHPLADLFNYSDRFSRLEAAAEAGHNLLAEHALDQAALSALPKGSKVRSVEQALADAGFQSSDLVGPTLPGQGSLKGGAYQSVLERINALRDKQGLSPLADLTGVYVEDQYARELLRYNKTFQSPESINPFTNAVDYLTNLFKGHVTASHPAFHIRNKGSGLWVNAVLGGPGAIAREADAYRMLQGQPLDWANQLDIFKGQSLTPEQATQQLARWAAGYGVSGHLPHAGMDVVGPSGNMIRMPTSLDDVMARVPGYRPTGWESIKETALGQGRGEGTGMWPKQYFQLAGAGGPKDMWRPVAVGREVGDVVEGTNRMSLFLSLMQDGWAPEAAAKEVLRGHFDYTKDALTNFEKTWMRRLLPFYCVPDDCEILTRDGWKRVDDLLVGEEVLALDHETGESRWTPCEDKAVFDYDGMLLSMGGERERFLFTPDHRWPVIQFTRSKGKTGKHRVIRRGYELRSNHHIPRTSEYCEDSSVATPREAAIVGWVVTDGYQRWRDHSPGHQEMVIYQSPDKYLDEIVALLGDGGSVGKPHPDTGVVPIRLVGDLRRRIADLLPTKDAIVRFVTRLNPEASRACYDAMLKAEGCGAGDSRGVPHFAQNDGAVLDAFQILAQLVGHVADTSRRGAYVSTRNAALKVCRANLSTVWYRGRVWCPRTRHGTWLMRRNGRVIWTGNTFTRQNLPFTAQQIATNPGGPAGTLARLAYAARQNQGEFLPKYMGDGLAIPLGGEDASGTRRYLTSLDLPPEQAMAFLKGTPGDPVQGSLMGLLSQMNPIIKAPIEYAVDKQFYSGRELGDLYSVAGDWLGLPGKSGQLVDQVLFNLPISRTLTDVRTLADPRKYDWDLGVPVPSLAIPAKLLSGVKMTDVDMPKYRDIAEREYIEARLQGDPAIGKFQQITVRPEYQHQLTPDEIDLIRLQRLREQRARERRKIRVQ